MLAYEIDRAGAHARRWEKKGASLLTTRNYDKYGKEIVRTLKRLSFRLKQLDGRTFYFGQEKPIGSAKETGESSTDRSGHALRQAILRLSQYADERGQSLLIFTDAVDNGPRLEAVIASATFIYSASRPELRRVMEVPMQLESHLYGTTQYADWVCAMLSRASHHHLVSDSEFGWAPAVLKVAGGANSTSQSKIRRLGTLRDCYSKDLCRDQSLSLVKPRASSSRNAPHSARSITQSIGSLHPELLNLRRNLTEAQEDGTA